MYLVGTLCFFKTHHMTFLGTSSYVFLRSIKTMCKSFFCSLYLFIRYGIRQAPRAWNAKLDITMKKMGFQQSAHEAAVYRRGSGEDLLLVGVYVDDLIITGADGREVEEFKAAMKDRFEMSDLGLLCFYLGVEVRQDAKGITLCQSNYVQRILELGNM